MPKVTRRSFVQGVVAATGLGAAETRKLRVLVLCTGNSARSQMTQAFLESFDRRLEVYSAGTKPAARVNPYAVRAMKEVGIDIANRIPKAVDQYVEQSFDFVFTVCDDADRNCPRFKGKVGKRVHIGFPDPAKATGTDDQIMAVFRQTRNNIQAKFSAYFQENMKGQL